MTRTFFALGAHLGAARGRGRRLRRPRAARPPRAGHADRLRDRRALSHVPRARPVRGRLARSLAGRAAPSSPPAGCSWPGPCSSPAASICSRSPASAGSAPSRRSAAWPSSPAGPRWRGPRCAADLSPSARRPISPRTSQRCRPTTIGWAAGSPGCDAAAMSPHGTSKTPGKSASATGTVRLASVAVKRVGEQELVPGGRNASSAAEATPGRHQRHDDPRRARQAARAVEGRRLLELERDLADEARRAARSPAAARTRRWPGPARVHVSRRPRRAHQQIERAHRGDLGKRGAGHDQPAASAPLPGTGSRASA